MKHLKTYEIFTSKSDTSHFDKYLVITSNDINKRYDHNRYYILEVLKILPDSLDVIKLYTYDNGVFRKYSDEIENPKSFNLAFNNSLLEIIYESNDLDDVFNMIKILDNTTKYNI